MNDTILEIRHLKKYYHNIVGIEDVSIKLKKGEIYGFIGPNGAGKSTTIRTIMGLIQKTSGDIFLDGNTFNIEDKSIKEEIGYLPSEVSLYSDMKVKEIFDFHESFYQKDIHKNRLDLVKKLKVDENRKIEDLSLGNLKKVGIILAIMHRPKILILDEPTSGLDPIIKNVFHDILKKERDNGTLILYSSHVLSDVSSLCDRVGFIKNGKIIKEVTREKLDNNNYTYLTIVSKDIAKIKGDLKLLIKEEKDDEVKFINNLDANQIIKKLAKYDITKILIEEIPLEDLFINYYR